MKINREIIRLAIPNILSNISVPLISSVDTGLMGHTSTAHLAAIGTSAMIFNFLYWNFGFLRMGATGLIAQAHGAMNVNKKSKIFFQSVMIALIIAALILIFQKPISRLSFNLMNLEGTEAEYAFQYFFIRVWDAPATIMLYVIMAWFFGSQNSMVPFLLTLIINISNIGLSVLLVKVYDMGITGVAIGSVVGNYLGMIVGLSIIIFKKQLDTIPWEDLFENMWKFLNINKDIFIRTFLLSITFSFLYSQSAYFGAVYVGVNVVLLQFLNWMSYGVDGFAYAAESLVGKYKGAKDDDKLIKTIRLCLVWGAGLAAIFGLCYGLFFTPLSRIFTNENVVLETLQDYRIWIAVVPMIGFASYIWDGVFIGLTASKAMRNTMLISFIGFIASYYLLAEMYQFNALIIAFTIYLILRGLSQTVLYWKRGVSLQ